MIWPELSSPATFRIQGGSLERDGGWTENKGRKFCLPKCKKTLHYTAVPGPDYLIKWFLADLCWSLYNNLILDSELCPFWPDAYSLLLFLNSIQVIIRDFDCPHFLGYRVTGFYNMALFFFLQIPKNVVWSLKTVIVYLLATRIKPTLHCFYELSEAESLNRLANHLAT